MNNLNDKVSARLLAFGGAAITLFMLSNGVTDPVNVTKFFATGLVGFGCLALLLTRTDIEFWKRHKIVKIVSGAFLASGLFAVVMSEGPLTQNLYGSYGRNNGFLAYLSLVAIMLLATSLRSVQAYRLIVYSLLFSGLVNVLYCLWVLVFGDFMAWNNTYNNLLGTFGNPNFIGSFLSIFAAAAVAFSISPKFSWMFRAAFFGLAITASGLMIHANVMQGKVVLVLGCSLVLGSVLRGQKWNQWITSVYFTAVAVLGVFAVLGILQKGPLTQYIYQYTVSLRGQYWKAGFETGLQNFFTGVGFDSFGDWYRRTRSPQALITPGVDVTTNSAHNVPIDMFAFGGVFLASTYLILVAYTAYRIVRFFVSMKSYDPIFVTIAVAWIGYQAQSVISINQLGLAVWGWLLSGSIVGYTGLASGTEDEANSRKIQKNVKKPAGVDELLSPGVTVGIGALIGAILTVPPLTADMNFRAAQVTGNAQRVQQALEPTYMHPQNTNTFLNSIISFEQAGLNQQALEIATKALQFNPDSFETWRALYFLTASTNIEKDAAVNNMKRLDPLNPDVTSLPK